MIYKDGEKIDFDDVNILKDACQECGKTVYFEETYPKKSDRICKKCKGDK